MRILSVASAVVLVWMAASAAAAQPAINAATSPATTISQATARAMEQLPDLAAADALRSQVAAQRRAARGPFVGPPLVMGDVELGNEGLSEQEVGVRAGFRWPGEGRAARLAADRSVALIDATLDAARLQIAGEVRSAWWALASARAVLAVEQQQAGLADQEVAAIARLVTAGVQARRDLLLAQAERSAINARLSAVENDAVGAQAAFEALAGQAPANFPPEVPASAGTGVDEHPAVRAALSRATAAEARVAALRFGNRPRIEGSVGVRRERNDLRDGFDNALLVGVGVPIGRNYSATAEIAGARSEALRASAEAARTRTRLVAERLAGGRRLAVARRAVGEAEARRSALADALTLTERGRREGEIGYLEVLRARQTLGQATRDLAVARVTALAAISTYNQAQGVLP